ncbi:MAG: hypothetical protein AAGD25_18950 [Cyanobacteria bacterium P01_F01_bin.150]
MTRTSLLKTVPLHPLAIPTGWIVAWNCFYAIDPDSSLETLDKRGLLSSDELAEISSNPQTIDVWTDIVGPFFAESCLWRAHRKDYACEISLEWTPQGDKGGYYWLTEGRSRSITFAKKSKKRIRRTVENIELCYSLEPPVAWIPGFHRELKSRSRQDIAMALNQWLDDSNSYQAPKIRANQVDS